METTVEAADSAVSAAGAGLARRLGAADGAALIVSNVVGIGIFTTPGLVASLVGGPGAYLGLWLVGGALALVGGLVYAELGGAYPEAGGEYVYIRKAFGPAAAFLSGWTSLVAGFSGAIAAGAVGFAIYIERLVPGLVSGGAGWSWGVGGVALLDLTPRRLIALGLIAVLALVHARGLEPGRRVQNALAASSVLAILALVVVGLLRAPSGPFSSAAAWTGVAEGGASGGASGGGGLLLALVLVMFTYSGWNAATYVAGEIRSPRRTLRTAVVGGTLLVTAVYFALNLLYLRTVPLQELGGSVTTAELAAGFAFGRLGGAAAAVVVGLALASGVSAMLVTGPRVYFAMARDGALPATFGRVDPRARVPSFAVTVQALWAAALVLTGTFEALLTYTGFAVVLFSAAAVASLFVLRRRPFYPRSRTVPAWGYPWAPAAFLVASVAMLVQAIRFAPGPSLAGLALIAAGLPLYRWTRQRAGIARAALPALPGTREGDAS